MQECDSLGASQPPPVLHKPLLGIDIQLLLIYLLGDHARDSLAAHVLAEPDMALRQGTSHHKRREVTPAKGETTHPSQSRKHLQHLQEKLSMRSSSPTRS